MSDTALAEAQTTCDKPWCAAFGTIHYEGASHRSETFVRKTWTVELIADGNKPPKISITGVDHEPFNAREADQLVSDILRCAAETRAIKAAKSA